MLDDPASAAGRGGSARPSSSASPSWSCSAGGSASPSRSSWSSATSSGLAQELLRRRLAEVVGRRTAHRAAAEGPPAQRVPRAARAGRPARRRRCQRRADRPPGDRAERRLRHRLREVGQAPPRAHHVPHEALPRALQQEGPAGRARWEAQMASSILADRVGFEVPVQPSVAIYGPSIPWKVMRVRDVDVYAEAAGPAPTCGAARRSSPTATCGGSSRPPRRRCRRSTPTERGRPASRAARPPRLDDEPRRDAALPGSPPAGTAASRLFPCRPAGW